MLPNLNFQQFLQGNSIDRSHTSRRLILHVLDGGLECPNRLEELLGLSIVSGGLLGVGFSDPSSVQIFSLLVQIDSEVVGLTDAKSLELLLEFGNVACHQLSSLFNDSEHALVETSLGLVIPRESVRNEVTVSPDFSEEIQVGSKTSIKNGANDSVLFSGLGASGGPNILSHGFDSSVLPDGVVEDRPDVGEIQVINETAEGFEPSTSCFLASSDLVSLQASRLLELSQLLLGSKVLSLDLRELPFQSEVILSLQESILVGLVLGNSILGFLDLLLNIIEVLLLVKVGFLGL